MCTSELGNVIGLGIGIGERSSSLCVGLMGMFQRQMQKFTDIVLTFYLSIFPPSRLKRPEKILNHVKQANMANSFHNSPSRSK